MNATIRWRLRHGRARDEPRSIDSGSADVAGAAARHDHAAFAEAYRRWGTPVYRYCLVRLGSPEAAVDATGAVFLRALNGWDGFRGGSLPGWLFAIARNVVADAARQRSMLPLTEAFDRADDRPGPEEVALAGDAARALRAMLGSLTDDQRRVVELRLSGLRGAEIAAVLGRTEAAVKMLQLRAMQGLRALNDEGAGDGA